MVNSVDTFVREVDAETQKFVDDVNKGLENTMLYSWSLVTASNPVRTGRSRASWLVTVDEIKDHTKPPVKGNKLVYKTPRKPKLKYDFLHNRSLYLTNNVDYIEYLEYGTDKFAPFAMVSSMVPKAEAYTLRWISKLNNKEY